jgi:hypothetical protein
LTPGADNVVFVLSLQNWAPRGARAFRLRELPPELQQRDADKGRTAASAQASDSDLALDLETALEAMRVAPEGEGPLTGEELMVLSLGKYQVAYDMAIKQVDVMSGSVDRFVALNIYGGHLHQKSFPLSREQYLEKLDAIAMALNAWVRLARTPRDSRCHFANLSRRARSRLRASRTTSGHGSSSLPRRGRGCRQGPAWTRRSA